MVDAPTREGTRVGVQLPAVAALLDKAAAHYRSALRTSPEAVHYLANRGITGTSAARFGLGYARPRWQDLREVFADQEQAAIDACGLVATSDGESKRRYDRFRDRLMFPIRTRTGQLAGFGGRVLVDGEAPKYLNSPEGPGFRKRELLYGLFEGQDAIRAEDLAVVVEGYLDVISLSQAGFGNAVATLGTACSRAQVDELLGLTSRVVFCFDGDAAGHRAAAAALVNVLPQAVPGRRVEFMFLPPEHDPDSFVRAHGVDAFRSALADCVPLAAYLRRCAASGCDLQYPEGRARCAHRLRDFYLKVPDPEARAELVSQCAAMLGCEPGQVVSLWQRPGRCM